VNTRLPIVGMRRTIVTSLMVLLAIITPASSGTRQPATLPDRMSLDAAPALGAGLLLADTDRTPDRVDTRLLQERDSDAVLLASEVFPGVDLVIRRGGDSAYAFVIRPYARPDAIRLSMAGAERLEFNGDGDLLVQQAGRLIRQERPRAHQETPRGSVEVQADYRIGPDGDVRFAVGPYDRSRPLVIEPRLTKAMTNNE
jgi:hypothetical protein